MYDICTGLVSHLVLPADRVIAVSPVGVKPETIVACHPPHPPLPAPSVLSSVLSQCNEGKHAAQSKFKPTNVTDPALHHG